METTNYNLKTVSKIVTFLLIIFSCKNDDDTMVLADNPDPIIGQWQSESAIINGEPAIVDECVKKSIIIFSLDGNYSFTRFVKSVTEENCQKEGKTDTGAWENQGNGRYNIGNTNDVKISFSTDGNSFTGIVEDEDSSRTLVFKKNNNQDPILGKWTLTSATFNGESEPINNCRAQTSLEFFASNLVVSVQYAKETENTECAIEEETKSTWRNIGNATYQAVDGEGMTEPIDLTFSNNNNTINLKFETAFGDLPILITRTYDRVIN